MNPDKFDASWRSECSVYPRSIGAVNEFIMSHYLKKRPAIVLLCLEMWAGCRSVGCIVFSAPPPETSKRYGGETWELARLFILDEIPRNAETWLIGQAVKHIKRTSPSVQYLVSYADPGAGHAGTIYKAANWLSDGQTNDDQSTPRCDYADANTGKRYGRRGNVPTGVTIQRVPRTPKWRFYLPLQKRGGADNG